MRADFDFDDDRRGGPRDYVLRVLRIAGEALLVVAALAILYLAFRGPSGHPPARAVPATSASPYRPRATGLADAGQGTGARSAGLPSPTPTAAPAPSASPAPRVSQAAGPLGARAMAYLAGRRGRTEAAVYDLSTGRQWTLGPQAPQAEESLVKLEILQAVLYQRKVRRTVMSLTEQELTPPMIEQNDDEAATTLWGDVGGAKGMRAFDHTARLVHTSPSACLRCPGSSGPGWGLTTTTAQDQITLLRQLVRPSRVLDTNSQKYALRLLENVTPAQRWGVSGGVPAGVTVAVDDGGRPLAAGRPGWQVNSEGWVSGGGRNYLMAVLSTAVPGEQYGVQTLNRLGEMVWSALAPRRG